MTDKLVLILFVVAGVAVNTYPIVYAFRPWWSTPAGRAIMVKACGNMILVDMALASLLFGQDYPGRDVISLIGLTVFCAGVWYLLVVLLRTPRDVGNAKS